MPMVTAVKASTIDAEHREHAQPRAEDVLPPADVAGDDVEDGATLDLERDARHGQRERHDERGRVHQRDRDLSEHRVDDADAVARQRGIAIARTAEKTTTIHSTLRRIASATTAL